MVTAAATTSQVEASAAGRSLFDLAAFDATPLEHDPFDYMVVPEFIRPEMLDAINADYPRIDGPGNVAIDELTCGPVFQQLLGELRGPELAGHFASKFDIDLSGCATTISVRSFSETTDGHIHTDHKSKLITVLLYFNKEWPHAGGRLRMLRSADDMEDYTAEVLPEGGKMLAFRRTDDSFHGHKPHVGERRILQLSWTRGGDVARKISGLTRPIRRLLNLS